MLVALAPVKVDYSKITTETGNCLEKEIMQGTMPGAGSVRSRRPAFYCSKNAETFKRHERQGTCETVERNRTFWQIVSKRLSGLGCLFKRSPWLLCYDTLEWQLCLWRLGYFPIRHPAVDICMYICTLCTSQFPKTVIGALRRTKFKCPAVDRVASQRVVPDHLKNASYCQISAVASH